MKLDKTQISGSQFMFAITCFIQASTLLTSFLSSITMQDSWLAVLFGAIACLPLLWLFRTLMIMFPDKNLLQILDEVFGPVAGKIIGVAYAWFFLTLTSLNLMDMGDFSKLTIMVETPKLVLVIMCMLVCAWAVRFGIKSVARYSTLFTVTAFFILAVTVLLVLNQADFENFLPMFDQPAMKYVQATHISATIPFGELVVFLMIRPNVKMSRSETTKYLFSGFAMGGFTVLVVMMRDIAVLDNTMQLFTLPGLVTLRLVNLGEALSRIEIIFAIVLIMLFFFKVSLLYYVTVITIAQLLKIKVYRRIVLVAGALIIAYGFTLYPNPIEHTASSQEIVPIVWTLFEAVIPLLTFIIAKVRKLPKAKAVV